MFPWSQEERALINYTIVRGYVRVIYMCKGHNALTEEKRPLEQHSLCEAKVSVTYVCKG